MTRYLSKINVWALSFGCAVGWGAFVMPATTFLPIAGPLGTLIGIIIGTMLMMVIGVNYYYLINKYPDKGGTLTYAIKTFGHDHGFVSSWFLVLVYVSILWANMAALALFSKYLFGEVFRFGFHYTFQGYEVWFGEILLSISAIVVFGMMTMFSKRLSGWVQTVMALLLFTCVAGVFIAVVSSHHCTLSVSSVTFSPNGRNYFWQVFHIIFLTPWAFVGFESVSHSVEEMKFSPGRMMIILALSLIAAAIAYILLTFLAVSFLPHGMSDWASYMNLLGNEKGFDRLATFYAVDETIGKGGLAALIIAAMAAIFTGFIGNYIAAGRLLSAMSQDGILPEWFGRLSSDGAPRNAILFMMIVSSFIPFLGRVAIGWIVDVATIGASIAYGYTSIAAFCEARRNNNHKIAVTGMAGFVVSVGFIIYFMLLSAGDIATESYIILAAWCVFGLVFFRYVFSRDTRRHFGKSLEVWIALVIFIFFISLVWIKQSNDDMVKNIVVNLGDYYEQIGGKDNDLIVSMEKQMISMINAASRLHTRNSIIQIVFIMISMGFLFSLLRTVNKREHLLEIAKIQADESNKAKSRFLSSMSHDIRTPMNAIIGYTHLVKAESDAPQKVRDYIDKIDVSGQQLLAIINDVLEMSRIESGKMELNAEPADLGFILQTVYDIFQASMAEKHITYTVDTSGLHDKYVIIDKNHFDRVLMNLVSNAYKFTAEGGHVWVTMTQVDGIDPHKAMYELSVKDDGIGMSSSFAQNVFEAFEREKTSTVSGIQGTGLGLAITKMIIDAMHGTIVVDTAPGKGSEFRVCIELEKAAAEVQPEPEGETDETPIDLTGKKILLVEDIEINREIAAMILETAGFIVDAAVNGEVALRMVEQSEPGSYSLVLMDIQMPVMDGYEATKAIRNLPDKALAGIPIIAVTANAFKEDEIKAREAGMDAHVSKPLDVDKLMAVITQVLRKHGE